MIPFLHFGPITIPTFGLMVAIGLLVAAYVLQADFNRRRQHLDVYRPKESDDVGLLRRLARQSHNDEGFLIIGIAGIAGLLGAKIYHALQDPQTWRTELISRFGFAWFGGLIGGFVALVYLEAVRNTDAGVHGYLLACSVGGLRDRADWVFAFGRRRLRRANDAAMGHELPKRRHADNGARTPHADLRICDLAADCCSFVADGEKNAER